MKMHARGMLVMAALVLLAAPIFAAGNQEVDFLAEFEAALVDEGLSEDQAQAIAEAARSFDWSDANRADPEVVAEAVASVEDDDDPLTPDENAQLALELARTMEDLEDDGHTRSEVATAALEAVAQLQEQIRAWHDGDQEEPLGETVRNTVSDRVRSAARERAAESGDGDDGDDDDGEEGSGEAPVETGPGAAGEGNR